MKAPLMRAIMALTMAASLAPSAPSFAQDDRPAAPAGVGPEELGALFGAGEQAIMDGDYEGAAAHFDAVISMDANGTYAAEARLNIASCYDVLARPHQALDHYAQFSRDFPKHDFASYALFRVAALSERTFAFDAAARHYVAFHDRYSDTDTPDALADTGFDHDDRALEALRAGAILLDQTNRHAEAAQAMRTFAATYPKHPDAPQMLRAAITSFERAGDTASQMKAIERLLESYGTRPEHRLLVFEVLRIKARHEQAVFKSESLAYKAYNDLRRRYEKAEIEPGSPETRIMTQATLEHADDEFERARTLTLAGPISAQKVTLDEMITRMEQNTRSYENVFTYGDIRATLDAASRIAEHHEHFARTLRRASSPHPASNPAHKTYRTQLDHIAVPVEDDAIRRYEFVVKKARDEGITTRGTTYAAERLHALDPEKYPKPAPAPLEAMDERGLSGIGLLGSDDLE